VISWSRFRGWKSVVMEKLELHALSLAIAAPWLAAWGTDTWGIHTWGIHTWGIHTRIGDL